MGQAFTPGLIVSKNSQVERIRELPVRGEVVVKPGDTVQATQVVARAHLPGELHILRIAEKLGIEAFEVVKGLRVQVGDAVSEGQVLCEHAGLFGLFRSRFTSPVSGTVELITEGTGHVAVRMAAVPIEVKAYLAGKVVSVDSSKSATIQAKGAFIQGIFGIGGERQGTIRVLSPRSDRFQPSEIPTDCAGAILIVPVSPTLEALRAAAKGGAVALVTGSIDDQVLAGYLGFDLGIALTGDEDVSMSLIITEGFGDLRMSSRIFDLCKQLDGRPASVNGATQVRAGAVRPEIIIPIETSPVDGPAVSGGGGLSLGSAIRIIRVPYFGRYATVHELPHEMQQIETGAYARVLRARLEDGTIVTVPRANVELV